MNDLLDLVLEAHGGLENWRQTSKVNLRLNLGGNTLAIKGHPDGLKDALVSIDTRQPRAVIAPAPHQGARGVFDHGRAIIQSDAGDDQAILEEPRASFAGHTRMTTWTDIQFVYFFGYAFWNYFTTPFLLAADGVRCQELEPHEEHGERWRVLKAVFDKNVDTHCAEQLFYFNEKGWLQRHDYYTDVGRGQVGHYVFDHKVFDGFLFPTMRRVVLRDDNGHTNLTGPTSFSISIGAVSVA